MSTRQIEKKIERDTNHLKDDLKDLGSDNDVRMKNFGNSVKQSTDQAEKDVTRWVGNGVSQVSDRMNTLNDEARAAVVQAAAKLKKEANQSLDQYNDNAQQLADKIPGGFGEKVAKYPWVSLSIVLLVGVLLGSMIRFIRRLF